MPLFSPAIAPIYLTYQADTFSSPVNRVVVQNNTSANVNLAFDTAASAGALLLVPGALLVYPKKMHGTSSGGLT